MPAVGHWCVGCNVGVEVVHVLQYLHRQIGLMVCFIIPASSDRSDGMFYNTCMVR